MAKTVDGGTDQPRGDFAQSTAFPASNHPFVPASDCDVPAGKGEYHSLEEILSH